MVWYEEDVIPEVRNSGKDQAYAPILLYADRQRQFIFLKSHGFDYMRYYGYDPVQRREDLRDEYPFETEPKVYLRIEEWVSQKTGIVLTTEGARYSLDGFDLYSYEYVTDYACVPWEANIPDNVEGHDLHHSPSIRRVRLIREKNLALLFAALKPGLYEVRVWSEVPNELIRIKEVARVGRRFEIWMENDGPPARLHTLEARIDPGRRSADSGGTGTTTPHCTTSAGVRTSIAPDRLRSLPAILAHLTCRPGCHAAASRSWVNSPVRRVRKTLV